MKISPFNLNARHRGRSLPPARHGGRSLPTARHRGRSLLLGLGLALGLNTQTQTATDQPLCQALASLQRTIAEQRDRGLSLSDAQRAMRVAIEQAPELRPLQGALLGSLRRTYELGLSPDMTEITAYGVCIEALRKD